MTICGILFLFFTQATSNVLVLSDKTVPHIEERKWYITNLATGNSTSLDQEVKKYITRSKLISS
jgi:hypothetical protein